jgi:hypothetical protein
VSPGNAERLRAAGSPLAVRGRLTIVNEVDLQARVRRNPRWFATPGTPHFWTRLPLRAGFWMAAQYRHVPGATTVFLRDLSRYGALRASYLAGRARTVLGNLLGGTSAGPAGRPRAAARPPTAP